MAGELVCAALHLTPWLVVATWILAAGGMGLMYPRITAYVLAASTTADQGAHTSAMSISDSVGGAIALALTGLVFAAAGPASAWAPFAAVFTLTTGLGVLAVIVSRRTRSAAVPL